MPYLDEKTCSIIRYLLEQSSAISISELAQQANVSRRVVYYHLDKINDELNAKKLPIIENQPRVGISLSEQQRIFLNELVSSEEEAETYILNTDERQLLLMFYIALTEQRVTLEQLMQVSETSRNTVLNDIVTIRSYLASSAHAITLEVSKRKGYFFDGEDIAFLEFVYALLMQIFQSNNDLFLQLIKQILQQNADAAVLLSPLFQQALYDNIIAQEPHLGKEFNRKDLEELLQYFPYFILALRNIPSQQLDEQLQDVFARLEYRIAMRIMTQVSQQFELVFSVQEVYFLALMLLSIRKNYDKHSQSPAYHDLQQTLMAFIELFEVQAGVQLENKQLLCDHLVMHFKALLYRKKYNVFTFNPLTPVIREKYHHLYELVKLCAPFLEDALEIQLQEDDVAYITVHIGGALRNEEKHISSQRIVIVTDEGVGIQKLIKQQCHKYLSRAVIVAIVSDVADIANIDETIDFIVSTIPDIRVNLPYVTVMPIFQAQDIVNLLKVSAGLSLQNEQETLIQRLDQVLAEYVPNALKRSKANLAIQQIFNEQFYYPVTDGAHYYPLEEKQVQIVERVADYDEAIALTGQPLLERNSISPTYLTSIQSEIEKRGLYMSVYPEVVLLHSHYIPNETIADITFLFVREPLQSKDGNFRLFIMVATQEQMQHLPLILGVDRLLKKGLLSVFERSQTTKEVLNFINQHL
ncbi:BglG family transcription antiterminator [Aerococcaceae bacterium NML190938]|nr:BglG family transcription antiterminator [Aerococcaceae bacterium NML190938]